MYKDSGFMASRATSPAILPRSGTHRQTASGKRYFWTTRELKLLRLHYPNGGAQACLEVLPGRTEQAIYQKALHIGVHEKKPKHHDFRNKKYRSNPDIDRLIRDTYQNVTGRGQILALARKLDRPRWWVSKRAATLGVVLPRFKEPEWTEQECDILEKNAHKNPETIRRILLKRGYQRSATAILVKRKRIRCDLVDPNHYTAHQLADQLGKDAKTVTSWIVKGWLPARKRGTARTEKQGGDHWWIKRKDIKAFVIKTPALIDFHKVDKYWLIDLLTN